MLNQHIDISHYFVYFTFAKYVRICGLIFAAKSDSYMKDPIQNLFLLLFIFFGLTVDATTYYVSSYGNDANNGTSATTPWRTIAKINSSTFLPGDFILFRRGDVWREQLIIPSSGVAGKPITFSAYGSGAKPIINGADLITNWVSTGTNIWSITSPPLGRAMVIVDDSIFAEASSIAALSKGKYFIGNGNLYVYSTTNPNTRKAEVSKREFCIYSRSTDLRHHVNITGIEMRYAAVVALVQMEIADTSLGLLSLIVAIFMQIGYGVA